MQNPATLLTLKAMKSRYLFLAASVAFLIGAAVEFFPPRNTKAAILDAVAGAIFLYLGAAKPRTKS
jgi:hypothetical protein